MAASRPPLIFVRHGETNWNRDGIIQGWTDTALNETGHRQARQVADALARDLAAFHEFEFIASPMIRTRQTMQYIRAALGAGEDRLTLEPRVKELGFGIWEGRPFWELKASPVYPPDPIARFSWQPEGGESYADGNARLAGWLGERQRPAIVVAHGAIGRCLIGLLAGLDTRGFMEMRMRQGAYCLIEGGKAQWFDAGPAPA
jgi:probable phosphoglycerate mutase